MLPIKVPQHGGNLWVELSQGDVVTGAVEVRQLEGAAVAEQLHRLVPGEAVKFNPKSRHAT